MDISTPGTASPSRACSATLTPPIVLSPVTAVSSDTLDASKDTLQLVDPPSDSVYHPDSPSDPVRVSITVTSLPAPPSSAGGSAAGTAQAAVEPAQNSHCACWPTVD